MFTGHRTYPLMTDMLSHFFAENDGIWRRTTRAQLAHNPYDFSFCHMLGMVNFGSCCVGVVHRSTCHHHGHKMGTTRVTLVFMFR